MSNTEFNFSSDNLPKRENRLAGRTITDLKTIVQVKDSDDTVWKEITKVTTVSRNGAGFMLKRECVVGRLVTLVMPMPAELRAYDQYDDLYPVMGLVQYCNEAKVDGEPMFNVGVGFIGKQKPDSYKNNPLQSYRIIGMSSDGLWQVTEAESQHQPRKNARFWVPIEVTISLIKKDKSKKYKENVVTQNISASGASVPCSLDAGVGDRVKVACKAQDFYGLAVVRNRKSIVGEPDVLNLEFIDERFPIEKILFNQHDAIAA